MAAEDIIKEAERLVEARDFAAARQLLRSLLQEDRVKWDLRASFVLARCARGNGEHLEAAALFRRVAEMRPDEPERWNSVAEDLRAAKHYNEAAKIHRDVLAKRPHDVSALSGLAMCLRMTGDHAGAFLCFSQLAALEPENLHWSSEAVRESEKAAPAPELATDFAGLSARATQLREAGEYDSARAISKQFLKGAGGKIPVQAARAMVSLALTERAAGQHEACRDALLGAHKLNPDHAGILSELAGTEKCLGLIELSLGHLRTALRLEPAYPHALIALDDVRQSVAKTPEAPRLYLEITQIYQEVLAYEPDNVSALAGLAACLRQNDEHEAALSCFRRLVELQPDNLHWQAECAEELKKSTAMSRHPEPIFPDFSLLDAQACEYRRAGNYAAARDIALQFLHGPGEKNPVHACQAEICLALTERAAGRHDACRAALLRAHTLSPDHVGILAELAGTEKHMGLYDECIAHLRLALHINPTYTDAVRVIGELLQTAGEFEAAYHLYDDAVQANPADTGVRLGLAEALKAVGQADKAETILAELEGKYGVLPAVRCKRIEILRERGFYGTALQLARDATAKIPTDFDLCRARFVCELLYAQNPGVEETILLMRPANQIERARYRLSQGQAMESAMAFDEAQFYYQKAAELAPQDLEIQNNLTRLSLLRFDLEAATKHLHQTINYEASNRKLQGKSQNISQSFFGQLIDEFRIDADVVKKLQSVQIFPPAERAAAVLKLIPEYPNNTGVATMLLVAMRQAGSMCFQPLKNSLTIPRCIHQFWDTSPQNEIRELMRSWEVHNQDWCITYFDQTSAMAYIRQFYDEDVQIAFLRAKEPAMKADIFRLAVLAREGGVYADADDRCQAPLEPLLPEGADLILYQEDLGTIGNNFLAAAPGHPFIAASLRASVDAVNRGDTDLVWLATGPGLISRIFAETISRAGRCDMLPQGMVVLHRNEILPTIAMHCFVSYKKTNAHWTEGNFAAKRRPIADLSSCIVLEK